MVVSIKSNNTFSSTESCGRSINITNMLTQQSAVAMLVDECLLCDYDYMSVSQAVMDMIAPAGAANFSATYQVVDTPVKLNPAPASASYAPAPATQQQQQPAYTPTTQQQQQQYTQQQQQNTQQQQQYTQQQQQYTQQQQQTTKYEEPKTTYYEQPKQTYQAPTTTKYEAPKTTQQQSNNNNGGGSSNNNGGGGYSFYGQATWYTQDGNAGACGAKRGDGDFSKRLLDPALDDLADDMCSRSRQLCSIQRKLRQVHSGEIAFPPHLPHSC